MKAKTLLLFVLLFSAGFSAMAQSKKDVENNLNTCTKAKDSVQKLYTHLLVIHDSINKSYLAYDSMYRVIKTNVFLGDFNPLRTSVLLDSIRTTRNHEYLGLTNALNDSISILKKDNSVLKAKIDALEAKESEKAKVVNDLKQLKELLDAKIMTQEEFDAKKAKLIEKL
jgi:hypothetical protein